MMAVFFLGWHGESIWYAENRYAGSSDFGLTERGYAQAEALGRWAAQAGLADAMSCGGSGAGSGRGLKTATGSVRKLDGFAPKLTIAPVAFVCNSYQHRRFLP